MPQLQCGRAEGHLCVRWELPGAQIMMEVLLRFKTEGTDEGRLYGTAHLS